MNYIVTLNLNNYLCDNARQSMMDASLRWNCEFYEITKSIVGSPAPCFNKICGIKELMEKKDVDVVFYVDADILIRDDTPNPFELCTSDGVYVVKDMIDSFDGHEKLIWRSMVSDMWLREAHHILRFELDIDELIHTSPQWFFNAGMFLFNVKSNMDFIDLFIKKMPSNPVSDRIEQSMMNYMLKHWNKIIHVDKTWNRIDPSLSSGNMEDYIYHFTGFGDVDQTYKTLLLTYNWKCHDK